MNFLSRHFKPYSFPPVIEDSTCPHLGYFQWPVDREIEIDNKYYTLLLGAIVFNPRLVENESDLANTIAHEYRHYLQFSIFGQWTVPNWSDEKALDRYWSSHPCERDAFSFASAVCPCDAYNEICRNYFIPIMSRAQSLLLPRLSI